MEAYDRRSHAAKVQLRAHNESAISGSFLKFTSVGGIALTVSSAIEEILSRSDQNDLAKLGIIVTIVSTVMGMKNALKKRGIEETLSSQHRLHPTIVNGAFEKIRGTARLHPETVKFVQKLNDEDKGTLTVTD